MKSFIYKVERIILKCIRKCFYSSKQKTESTNLMSGEQLNQFIFNALNKDEPLMVARFGSIELDSGAYPYILSLPLIKRYTLFLKRKISLLHKDVRYENSLISPLCNNAGFFPESNNLLFKFSRLMQTDINSLDCCCFNWGKEELFSDLFNPAMKKASLQELEPYDYEVPWSKALKGKRVLVIHPFAKSIQSQYARRQFLWENKDILPDFELLTIKAVQTIAGEKAPFANWFEALEHMKKQMDAVEYDVAIIGCGAYGFHLAAHAKRMGHKAIHLGGATQILFGIKGKRWEELPAVSKFFNEYWVSPLPEETPRHKENVEGGCYW